MIKQPFSQGRYSDLPEKPRRSHRYFELESREVTIASDAFGPLRTHVRFAGPAGAPPMLLVHGLMTSSYSFRYVLDGLGAEYRLIIPDLPGAGRTARAPDVEHSPANLAAWIMALIRALDIEGCLALGNSMGGYLCMHAALTNPKAFARLVNVHSPGLATGRMVALATAMRVRALRGLATKLFGFSPLRFVHKNVHYYDESLKSLEEAREYGSVLADPDGAASLVRYLSDALGVTGMRAFEATLVERRERGESFPIPLLHLYADRDPMVPAAIGPRLHALTPGSELLVLDQTSHFMHVDTPDRVVDPVLRFFTRT